MLTLFLNIELMSTFAAMGFQVEMSPLKADFAVLNSPMNIVLNEATLDTSQVVRS
jgi:hypothetical protein